MSCWDSRSARRLRHEALSPPRTDRAHSRGVATATCQHRRGGVTFGDLRIDFVRRTVIRRGEEIELSRKEFDLLALFASRWTVVTREVCSTRCGGDSNFGHAHLDTHVKRLRQKIENDPATLVTHHYSWSGIPARPLTLPSCKKVTSPRLQTRRPERQRADAFDMLLNGPWCFSSTRRDDQGCRRSPVTFAIWPRSSQHSWSATGHLHGQC